MDAEYIVLVSEDEDYQAWPAAMELPLGWHDIGVRTTKAEAERIARQLWKESGIRKGRR